MRGVLYGRFSIDRQRKESIDDQFRICQRVAEQQGIRIVGRFADEGISGGTAERTGYQQLLAAARAGEFDLVIAEDISRLWRNRAEFGSRSAELEDLGVHLITAVGDDTRRDGWMVVTIKLALAEQQRREIAYRTRRGMEGLALSGQSTGGRCYGYNRNGSVHPQEAAVVESIFRNRAAGASLGELVRVLDCPSPSGGTWRRSTVQSILANQRYTGAVIWGARESYGGARDSRLKKRRTRSGGPITSRQDETKRIVSDALFRACNPEPVAA